MIHKRSFTLAEVLISMLIVGGAFSLFLPAIKGTTESYRTHRMQGTAHYLADEHFAREVLELLSKEAPAEIETLSKEFDVEVEHLNYRIEISLKPDEGTQDEDEKFMAILQVRVTPDILKKTVTRETKLCVAPQK